jgi:hypothetical protein
LDGELTRELVPGLLDGRVFDAVPGVLGAPVAPTSISPFRSHHGSELLRRKSLAAQSEVQGLASASLWSIVHDNPQKPQHASLIGSAYFTIFRFWPLAYTLAWQIP